jgi:hypothetical protein
VTTPGVVSSGDDRVARLRLFTEVGISGLHPMRKTFRTLPCVLGLTLTCGFAATARADDAGDEDAAVDDAAVADTGVDDALGSSPSADANGASDQADAGEEGDASAIDAAGAVDARAGEGGAASDAGSAAAPSTALNLPSESCGVSNGASPDTRPGRALFYALLAALVAIRPLWRRRSGA